ncbi:uncharacterized protein N7473_011106 [Penicillium subrubescens]|uniref:uncharacterized protein n=1 Tax=Penicillium subrubescens TaxID=1316194 RepID=UPI00254563B0|nr:uncharacterized protein N7473_011106 [Penicillium subrubescens]KAJ5882844.1 hypothetical protein N7473_011106 [Penicillium subrubescens]
MFKFISWLSRSGRKSAQTKPKETDSTINQEPVITEGDGSRPPPYPQEQAFTPGIEALWSPQGSKIDIVLVPDPGAGPVTAEPWPKTLLPSEMPAARILAFSYAQNTTDRKTGVLEKFICDLAVNFLDSLSSYREKDYTNERPIAFFCHALGGLVLLNSSEQRKPALCKIFACTRGIICLGTPFNGTGLANWLQSKHDYIGLSKQENIETVDFLRNNSDQIFDRITDQWKRIVNKPRGRLSPIDATFFYEESLPDVDCFMQKVSATLLGCSLIGIPCNNGDMTKITNAGDPLFLAISEKLHHLVADADTNARHQEIPSTAQYPLTVANQTGNHNCQYNKFGTFDDQQKIVEGSYFDAKGDQYFSW